MDLFNQGYLYYPSCNPFKTIFQIVASAPTWYEVLDDVHVRKWVNLGCLAAVINLADAGKGVHTTDVHGAAAADTLTARPENWERVL